MEVVVECRLRRQYRRLLRLLRRLPRPHRHRPDWLVERHLNRNRSESRWG
jgi:hypothetical protein